MDCALRRDLRDLIKLFDGFDALHMLVDYAETN